MKHQYHPDAPVLISTRNLERNPVPEQPPGVGAPALPATGSDFSMLSALGVLLAVVGAALLRRTKRRASRG